ncbi:MAG: bifunctional (p)ppGpp synthetase/guanosine-3',5'-bis(diphosphate) 3'-pyrophosphohydrolase [Calditrichia bacterium]
MIDYNDEKYLQLKTQFEPQFNELKKRIKKYLKFSKEDEERLNDAFKLALFAHKDQLRKSNEPYLVHLLSVVEILVEIHLDLDTIIAGLLHDTVEDTFVTYEELEKYFGTHVAQLVDGVTKLDEISDKFDSTGSQAENFRKMLVSITEDIRVLLIKLADRLHNMRTLGYLPAKKREKIARETLDVYAPLAHRFGMGKMKAELEDLAFKYLEHKSFNELVKLVNEKQEQREEYIQKFIRPIKRELKKHNKKFEIYGRPKHLYSIFQKIEKRQKNFEEIYDLFAIRILVQSIEDCYFCLGIVHQLFIPLYDRFKDYISVPKENGYRSLHTTVLGPDGKMVEVQIRTFEMHEIAEQGIAAHWLYKESVSKKSSKIDEYEESIQSFRKFLQSYKGENSKEFIEELKIQLSDKDTFVFTPKGDVVKLPYGSTPIDFAFAVHTNVGLHCIGAKVNNKIVSLKTPLKNGDVVEIITSQSQHPHDDWLKFVKTSKARSRIKRYLKEEKFEEDAATGEKNFYSDIEKLNISKDAIDLSIILKKLNFKSEKHLFASYFRGDLTLSKLLAILGISTTSQEKPGFIDRIIGRKKLHENILVDGEDKIDVHIAGCCQPIPGDDIVGYATKNHGITIHRRDCSNLLRLIEFEDRVIPVDWNLKSSIFYKVSLFIEAEDRKNLLKDITVKVSDLNADILHIQMKSDGKFATGLMVLSVNSLEQLNKIISSLRKMKSVLSVERKQTNDAKQKV